MVHHHPFLQQLWWFPPSITAPHQLTKCPHFPLVGKLALASISWETHQAARQLPELMGGCSHTGQWGYSSSFSHWHGEAGWSSSTTAPQLCLCCKRNWAQGQQMLERAGQPFPVQCQCWTQHPFKAQASSLINIHIPFSKAHIHWTETLPSTQTAKKRNIFKWDWGCAFPKREKKGLTSQHSSFFFSFLSLMLEILSNVAFDRD